MVLQNKRTAFVRENRPFISILPRAYLLRTDFFAADDA